MSKALANVHGHTTIELTNVETGEKKIYEDNNTVTNLVDAMLNSTWATSHPYGWRVKGFFPYFEETAKENVDDLTSGLMIFNKEIPIESDYNYLIPGDVTMLGCGSTYDKYKGVDEYGSYDQQASEDLSNSKTITRVWNFSTSQANGKIASICLTPKSSGIIGGGTLNYHKEMADLISPTDISSTALYKYKDYKIGEYSGCQSLYRISTDPKRALYIPHPFYPNSLSNNSEGGANGACTVFYPWYDLDNDELIITNQTCYGGTSSNYSIADEKQNEKTSFCMYKYNYNNSKFIINSTNTKLFDDCTGISKPLTLYKYSLRPTKWNLYSSYYKSNSINSDFDTLYLKSKNFEFSSEIKNLLSNSENIYKELEQKDVPLRNDYIIAHYYYSNIFATKDFLYQVFKPWSFHQSVVNLDVSTKVQDYLTWDYNESIYIWRIKTDFGKDEDDKQTEITDLIINKSEDIKLHNDKDSIVIEVKNNNIEGVSFNLKDTRRGDMSRVIVCDDYLFVRENSNNNLWCYSFENGEWNKILDKNENDFNLLTYENQDYFPGRTFYSDKNDTLYIRGSSFYRHEEGGWGDNSKSLIVKPKIKQGAILNVKGDFLDFINYSPATGSFTDYRYFGQISSRGKYTYIKTEKNIFNSSIFCSCLSSVLGAVNDAQLFSFNYVNPVLTTINNLDEEIEKTPQYTMKITYKVTWDNPNDPATQNLDEE